MNAPEVPGKKKFWTFPQNEVRKRGVPAAQKSPKTLQSAQCGHFLLMETSPGGRSSPEDSESEGKAPKTWKVTYS